MKKLIMTECWWESHIMRQFPHQKNQAMEILFRFKLDSCLSFINFISLDEKLFSPPSHVSRGGLDINNRDFAYY